MDFSRTFSYVEFWRKKWVREVGELLDKRLNIFVLRHGDKDVNAKDTYKLLAIVEISHWDNRIKPPTPHCVS
jgi:hypothetical protein